MAWEGLNIEDLNASRLNSALLNCSMLNAAVETRDTGGIAPVPSEDVRPRPLRRRVRAGERNIAFGGQRPSCGGRHADSLELIGN